jgi:GNAT superfamily N-acetyltransferase
MDNDVSFFKLITLQSSNQYRFELKLKSKKKPVYETVNYHTGVRLREIPNPNNRSRSNKTHANLKILYLDQLHVLKEFQRQRCGTKLMSLILIWAKYINLNVSKCVVVSPSSIGKPFYEALGAIQDISSRNLVFLM